MCMSNTIVVIIQKPKPRKYIDLLTIIKVSGAWLKTKKLSQLMFYHAIKNLVYALYLKWFANLKKVGTLIIKILWIIYPAYNCFSKDGK